ncbi:hypothetical protein, partial [Burkholderia vietnamiensis]|uniref:hypothetical protein n=1 Tax=Burkholderia vietnamiensis TaxID=60552 RepID=UPI003FEDFEAC
ASASSPCALQRVFSAVGSAAHSTRRSIVFSSAAQARVRHASPVPNRAIGREARHCAAHGRR